jgi:2-polyprenyl-3-methyl-5-hydroxy-6-metoxy-1,4-benzoquinol methylase
MTWNVGDANETTRRAWDQNARYWDTHIGEGNDFVEVLIWPATQRLLTVEPGQRVLDIACGNGLYARRMAALGAEVVAFDFSEAMIERAEARTTSTPDAERIEYRVLDATDEAALVTLGECAFDAAVCQMALFDMADIGPLIRALARMLRPNSPFLFSVMHPAFNQPNAAPAASVESPEGRDRVVYGMRVTGYLTSEAARDEAIRNQPSCQLVFHRPLHALLRPAFDAGFVLDALEEPAFPPDHPSGPLGLSWGGHFHEIPPVLIARLRLLS